MTQHKGIARLRAVIQNQSEAGESDVCVPLSDAMDILREVNDELDERVAREHEEAEGRRGRFAGLKVDLGLTEENPEHYEGDGVVSCSRAMRSMCDGWEYSAEEPVPLSCAYWAVTAFKYLWRFPLKGHPREDLMKAIDCANRALDAWER